MKAKFPGTCPECQEPIEIGDDLQRIVSIAGQEWVHVNCPDTVRLVEFLRDKAESRGVCGVCWQERSVAGLCGCDAGASGVG